MFLGGPTLNDFNLELILKEHNKGIFNGAVINKRTLKENLFERAQFKEVYFFKVQLIPRECFKNSAIIALELMDSIMYIGKSAFENCVDLKRVTIGGTLQTLGAECFKNCLSLESVSLPTSVKTIDPTSFKKCPNLKTIEISFKEAYGLEFSKFFSTKLCKFPIEQSKFLGNGLETLKQLRTLREDYPDCKIDYMNSKQFLLKDIDNFIKVIENESRVNHTKLIIEEGRKVITAREFAKREDIVEVVLPKTLRVMEDSAFELCTGLKKIIVQSMLNYIGNKAFIGCINLEVIETKTKKFDVLDVLPAKSIGDFAFYKCLSLKKLKLLSVATLGEASFGFCKYLKFVSIAGPLTAIPKEAFSVCFSLTRIEFKNPELLETLGDSCFYDCYSLEALAKDSFNGFANLKSMGKNVFSETNLRNFCYDGKHLIIGRDCFRNCYNLSLVSIKSKSYLVLQESVFSDCHNLNSVTLEASKVFVDKMCFDTCYNLSRIQLTSEYSAVLEQGLSDSKGLEYLIISSRILVWDSFTICGFQTMSLIDLYDVEELYESIAFQREDFQDIAEVDTSLWSSNTTKKKIDCLDLCKYIKTVRYFYKGTPLSLIMKMPKGLRELTIDYASGFNFINELWVNGRIRVVKIPSLSTVEFEDWGTNTDLQTLKVVDDVGNFSRLWFKELQLLDECNPDWIKKFKGSLEPFKDLVTLEISPETLILANENKIKESHEFVDEDFEGLF